MTTEEIVEMQRDKEAKARATILEIVGDIPDADIAPPENVLFVCKLNPVTNDDDLEIIFSRFGKIVGYVNYFSFITVISTNDSILFHIFIYNLYIYCYLIRIHQLFCEIHVAIIAVNFFQLRSNKGSSNRRLSTICIH